MDPTLGLLSYSRRFVRTPVNLLVFWLATLSLPGCVFDKFFPQDNGIQPIDHQLSQQALIEHLNQNIRGLHSWSCTDASIYTRPSKYLPMELKLSAQVAVERDKNFRLRARSLRGDEADFGSNSERFWFWMRANKPPYVFTARHEDMAAVGRRLQIPFHPTWIMEALGVAPLDPNSITVQQPGVEPNTVLLISEERSPSQELVRREIVVDTHLGVILAHRLYDGQGQKLAEARLRRHRREPSGIVMPHVIELDWPQHQMAMTMELSNIEINPSDLSEQTWRLPEDIPGSPPFDMGERLNNVRSAVPHLPAGERTTQSRTYLEPPPFADATPDSGWQPAGRAHYTQTATQDDLEPPPFY